MALSGLFLTYDGVNCATGILFLATFCKPKVVSGKIIGKIGEISLLKMFTFTREFRTVVPAIVNDIITIKLVKKAKTQKTMCVRAPKRALIT